MGLTSLRLRTPQSPTSSHWWATCGNMSQGLSAQQSTSLDLKLGCGTCRSCAVTTKTRMVAELYLQNWQDHNDEWSINADGSVPTLPL